MCVCVCVCVKLKSNLKSCVQCVQLVHNMQFHIQFIISHNFSLEGPISTIQTLLCSLQWAVSHGTLKSNMFFYSNFLDHTMD